MLKRKVRDLDDDEIRGKRALVRADFNVPLDENRNITDDTRIRAALPTLRLILDRRGKPIVLSHLGRPKGKPEEKYSLRPVAERLAELMRKNVKFVESTIGQEAVDATNSLGDDEILLLENTRFLPGEEKNDEEISSQLAKLGDVFVNDAFGAAHRAHSSTARTASWSPRSASRASARRSQPCGS